MGEVMYDPVLEPFLSAVRASHLIDDIRLRESVRQFAQKSMPNADDSKRLTAFQDFLVANEYLTRWQCEKLAKGKFKGFFLDNYVLLCHTGTRSDSSTFQAQERRTGDIVILDVAAPDAKRENVNYSIRRVDHTKSASSGIEGGSRPAL